jgi:hypothetical protein
MGTSMNRTLLLTLIVLCLLISATTGHAQKEDNNGPLNQPENQFSQLFESIQPMLTKTLETYLDFLAHPQTGEKIATFQKNYYDALMKKGFSGDQAFQLMRDIGNPLDLCGNNGCN